MCMVESSALAKYRLHHQIPGSGGGGTWGVETEVISSGRIVLVLNCLSWPYILVLIGTILSSCISIFPFIVC